MSEPTKVFISYAQEDEVEAERLYERLLQDGLKPWMSKRDILPGEIWGGKWCQKWCQEPFLGRPLLRMVFSSPNCATACETHFSEPYGRLFFIASRIFSTSSFGCERLTHCR